MTDDSVTKISPKIIEIVKESAEWLGRFESESFYQDLMYGTFEIGTIVSPIEQAIFTTLNVVARMNWLPVSTSPNNGCARQGIVIRPQYPIGPYKADFLVEMYYGRSSEKPFRSVVVECDGTIFHERTEKERRSEKLRDRLMQKMGLKVFRYTGSEILQDPYKIAAEIIGYVTDDEANTVTPKQYFE